MSRLIPLFGLSPRRTLIGLFVAFGLLAGALVFIDSTAARAVTATTGFLVLVTMSWLVLRGQFAWVFALMTRMDEDGFPTSVEPHEMPRFAPLAAAVKAREERGRHLRELVADLRAATERLAVTLEVATEGLFEIHFEPGNARAGQGRYLASGMEFVGVPVDEMVEHDILALNLRVKPEHRLAFQRMALSRDASDEIYGVDVQVKNMAGEWRWLSIRGRTLEFVGGEPVRIIAVLNDITHRRELERRAAHSDTMRSLGHLVSALTHDLSNVLAVVRANADLLLDFDVTPEDAERLARRTREMADDGFSLLRGLLDLTPSQEQASIVDLGGLVARIAESLQDLAPPGVVVEVRAAEREALVRVDSVRFDQVVLNVGLNALDAIGASGRVTMITRHLQVRTNNPHGLAAGDYVALDVIDDGSGIAHTIRETLFEPFASTKAAGAGTGLGLATSLDTVSQFGGTMWAANNEGSRGATVTIVLPTIVKARCRVD